MDNTEKLFISILAAVMHGKERKENLPGTDVSAILSLAKAHDLLPVVYDALHTNGQLEKKDAETYEKDALMTIRRLRRLSYEQERIGDALEKGGFDHIFLKGARMRELYPEPWMRTSCDIDVLVREKEYEKVLSYLTKTLGYERGGQTPNHTELTFQNGLHVEIHPYLMPRMAKAREAFQTVFAEAERQQGKKHTYRMSDAMFYGHIIAHAAAHFKDGGCGVRTVLDIWMLEKDRAHTEERNAFLKKCGLFVFAEAMRRLAAVWFSGEAETAAEENIGTFILKGGIYGNYENRVIIQQEKKGGRLGYFLYRVFMPYEDLRTLYPALSGRKYLLPFYEIRRFGHLVFCGRLRYSLRELRTNAVLSEKEKKQGEKLADSLEIPIV